MKKLIGAMLLAAFSATSAFGGTVTFMPSNVENVNPGDQLTMDVMVSSDSLGNWDAVSLLLGSDTVGISGFEFSDQLDPAFPPFVVEDTSTYPSGQLAGIFLNSAVDGVIVGTVTVDIPGAAAPGSVHNVLVDSSRDFDLSNIAAGTNQEGLTGSATITIVPEPATLALLGLGGIAVLRRRKA